MTHMFQKPQLYWSARNFLALFITVFKPHNLENLIKFYFVLFHLIETQWSNNKEVKKDRAAHCGGQGGHACVNVKISEDRL